MIDKLVLKIRQNESQVCDMLCTSTFGRERKRGRGHDGETEAQARGADPEEVLEELQPQLRKVENTAGNANYYCHNFLV